MKVRKREEIFTMRKKIFWSCVFIVCLFLSAFSSGEGVEIVKITNTPGQIYDNADMSALASMPEVEFFPALELCRFAASSPPFFILTGSIASLLYATCVLLLVSAID